MRPAPPLSSGHQRGSDLLGTPNDQDNNETNNQRRDDHDVGSDESKYDSNKGDKDDSSKRDKGDGNDTSANEIEKDLAKDMDNDTRKASQRTRIVMMRKAT